MTSYSVRGQAYKEYHAVDNWIGLHGDNEKIKQNSLI